MRVLLLSTLLLMACSGGPSESDGLGNGGSRSVPSVTVASPAEPVLFGTAEGLGFAGTRVMFGAPLAHAITVAEAAGGRSEPLQQLEECGAGPLVASRVGNLSLLGRDEQFIGWHISEGDPPKLRTDGGVTIGTPRSELQAAHDVEVAESSVGTEFQTTDGLGGVLSDASPTAKVTHLWAGTTCIMR